MTAAPSPTVAVSMPPMLLELELQVDVSLFHLTCATRLAFVRSGLHLPHLARFVICVCTCTLPVELPLGEFEPAETCAFLVVGLFGGI